MAYPTSTTYAQVRTHTVYTLPRDLAWHVEQRMPGALEEALHGAIEELTRLFETAGLIFEELVQLNFLPQVMGADIVCDFTGLSPEQLNRLGGILADRFPFDVCAHEFNRGKPDHGRKLELVEGLVQQWLLLEKVIYRDLLRDQEEAVKKTLPPHLVARPSRAKARTDCVEELEAGDGALPLGGPSDPNGVDMLIAEVYAKAPWMDAPLRRIWELMKIAPNDGLRFPPILLYGPGGDGKIDARTVDL